MKRGKLHALKVDSTKDNLVQLADMVTGAIARKYVLQGKNKHDQWYRAISHLINQEVLGEKNVAQLVYPCAGKESHPEPVSC
jgi:hypothetical protein